MFDEGKHPRDGDGKFTDKGGGEAKRVFELAEELGVHYDRNTSYQALKAKVEEAQISQPQLKEALSTLDTYSTERKNSIERNPLFKVARSYDDIKTFIDEAPTMKDNKYLFLGLVNEDYAKKIEKATGLNADNKSIAVSSESIKHIYNDHSNVKDENNRGQIAVDSKGIESIVQSIIQPDVIERSDENGTKGILFKKQMKNKITAVTVVSDKRGYLSLKTGWINK